MGSIICEEGERMDGGSERMEGGRMDGGSERMEGGSGWSDQRENGWRERDGTREIEQRE